jgi:RIO-like serine/threonine protein kinase
MSSDLFKSFGKDNNVSANQDPKTAAMSRMKEMGINVPEGMENNPQALLQHVLSSGKVPQNRLGMAQQMMQRMFGRR